MHACDNYSHIKSAIKKMLMNVRAERADDSGAATLGGVIHTRLWDTACGHRAFASRVGSYVFRGKCISLFCQSALLYGS